MPWIWCALCYLFFFNLNYGFTSKKKRSCFDTFAQVTPKLSLRHCQCGFSVGVWPWFLPSSKQGTAQEKEESETDLTAAQSPGVQEWLAQARSARMHQRENSLQQQRVQYFLPPCPPADVRANTLRALLFKDKLLLCLRQKDPFPFFEEKPGLFHILTGNYGNDWSCDVQSLRKICF